MHNATIQFFAIAISKAIHGQLTLMAKKKAQKRPPLRHAHPAPAAQRFRDQIPDQIRQASTLVRPPQTTKEGHIIWAHDNEPAIAPSPHPNAVTKSLQNRKPDDIVQPWPESRSTKRAVLKAHKKHLHDLDPKPKPEDGPTLNDRFTALPGELRNAIFAQVLVRPPKWDLPHDQECLLYKYPNDSHSNDRESRPHCRGKCAEDRYGGRDHNWHVMYYGRSGVWHQDDGIYDNLWRSKWAPKRLNMYLCGDCYNERWRPVPFPKVNERILSCLCGRRQSLEVLLVCSDLAEWERVWQVMRDESCRAYLPSAEEDWVGALRVAAERL